MDASFDIVALIETSPLTRLSASYTNRFINLVKENFTLQQQQMYAASFFCYLNYDDTNDFVVDLDDIWPWLGFSVKFTAKRLLEKNFKCDIDYKVIHANEQKPDGRGGHNRETIKLNIETFKRFCLGAGTQKAKETHDYYIRIEKIYHSLVREESDEFKRQFEASQLEHQQVVQELKQELEQRDDVIRNMAVSQVVPTIYIFNTDINVKSDPLLKIGVTKCLANRVKPYKQTNPYGKVVFHRAVDIDIKLNEFERILHTILKKYKINNEMYRIDEDLAITSIQSLYHLFSVYQMSNRSNQRELIKKLHRTVTAHEEHDPLRELYAPRDAFTETDSVVITNTNTVTESEENAEDVIESTQSSMSGGESSTDLNACFDKFIQDHCIVRPDVEVSSKDIIGQYRLVARQAKKEMTKAFTEYLNKGYVYGRLKHQDKDQVVMGYRGVMLKNLVYNKGLILCDEETFVFEKCIFTPSGTALYKNIWEEYLDWKRIMKKPVNEAEDDKKLKKYLKASPYVLFETVWSSSGGGQGFYGLKLKRDEKYHRKSTTGAVIIKKDNHGQVLCEFETIAKAAAEEGMCSAKMSRSIRDKTIFKLNDTDTYYYCKKNEEGVTS